VRWPLAAFMLGHPSPHYVRACVAGSVSPDVSEIKLIFSVPAHRPSPNFAPTGTPSPTDLLPVVLPDRRASERSLDLLRWGLIPNWVKDINVGFANINTEGEGIERSPPSARRSSGGAASVDTFYERKKTATGKQPRQGL
jgi:putative SOS response-associated peptidase YedK